jgi:hypothetical protein
MNEAQKRFLLVLAFILIVSSIILPHLYFSVSVPHHHILIAIYLGLCESYDA